MINYNDSMDLFELEPMKYWAMPANTSKEIRRQKLETIIGSGQYITSQKMDGNLIRAIITPNRFALQTRGRGVNSGEFGDIQDKVYWAEDVKNSFHDTTILLGEAYIDGGTDRTVGAVLRCLPNKAMAKQTNNNIVKYYIFDVLAYNGEFLFDKPIMERIKYLPMAAKAINSPLVSYAKYYEVNDTFWDKLEKIFQKNGEGMVLYKKTMTPCEGRTKAWDTVKVKQELDADIDAFVIGVTPSKMEYTGKEPNGWQYWYNTQKEILLPEGNHFAEYVDGKVIIPVTKSFYFGLPGAIECAVFDKDENIYSICKCSNLTDELSYDLKENFNKYYMRPCRIQGMMISHNQNDDTISVRHPKFLSFRDDISAKDCTLDKIIGG